MKKVLILVIGCNMDPWDKMVATSEETWDSIKVEGCETIFYFGEPVKENTHNKIYFPIRETYFTMGEKMLRAFEWCLANKEFDYIARVNSSCYVDKAELIKHIQTLPDKHCFSGVETVSQNNIPFLWGGCHMVMSRDVVNKIVVNKEKWNHTFMEDESLSLLATEIGIPFHPGKACSINKTNKGWLCLGYGGDSIEFTDFADLKPLKHFFFRVKQDDDRNKDKYLMLELYKTLIG